MRKSNEESTRWWLCNADDATQITCRFHGMRPTHEGSFEWDRHLERIRSAVIGEPKKRILGMVEWAIRQENEARQRHEDPSGGPVEPFVASVALEAWAIDNGRGKYAYEKSEE